MIYSQYLLDNYNLVLHCDFKKFLNETSLSPFPPLYNLGMALTLIIIGKNWLLATLLDNTIYLVILVVFSYLLGKEIKDKDTGIIAAILVLMYPMTYGGYGQYSLDFPAMGFMVMSIYFLHRSEYFKITKWSMLFGISCGSGMMIKDPFGAFIIGPIFYGLYLAVKSVLKDKKITSLVNFVIFCIIFYIIIYPYYFKNIYHINSSVLIRPMYEDSGLAWYDFRNLRIFTIGLWESQLTPPFFIVFIIGLYYFLKHTDKRLKITLFLWIVIPNITLILMPHWKTARYLMPLLPALAIISSIYVRSLIDMKYGKVIFVLLIALGVVQCEQITFGSDNYKSFLYYSRSYDINLPYNMAKANSQFLENIKQGVIKAIKGSGRTLNEEYTVVVPVSDSGTSLDSDLKTYFFMNGIKINTVSLSFKYYLEDTMLKMKTLQNNPDKADFILYTTKDIDLKNPVYFTAFNEITYSGAASWEKARVGKLDLNEEKSIWKNIVNNYNSRGIISSLKQGDQSYFAYLYENNNFNKKHPSK
jgi:hypothetical protein